MFRQYQVNTGYVTHKVTAKSSVSAVATVRRHYANTAGGFDFSGAKVRSGKKLPGAKCAKVTGWSLHGPYYDKDGNSTGVGYRDPDLGGKPKGKWTEWRPA